eukprot:Skav227781  [mRNA]  locus=scaffold1237:123606:130350:+ [translate_table: standard]
MSTATRLQLLLQAALAEALAVKLLDVQEQGVDLSFDPIKSLTGSTSPTASTTSEGAIPDSISSVSEEDCRGKISKPRFLNSVTLSQIDWSRIAKMQEWRTEIQLRGLPPSLCKAGNMEAFLKANDMEGDVAKVKVTLKANGRHGNAVLEATSTQAVGRLSRFFHGRQLPGSRLPIAVERLSQSPALEVAYA